MISKNKEYLLIILIILISLFIRLAQPLGNPSVTDVDQYNWASVSKFIIEKGNIPDTTPYKFPITRLDLPKMYPLIISIIQLNTGVNLIMLYIFLGAILTSLSPLFLFILVKRLSGQKSAFICALVYASLPILLKRSVFTVSENTVYIFLPFFFFMLLGFIQSKRLSYIILLFLMLPLMISFHQSMILLAIPMILTLIMSDLPFKKPTLILSLLLISFLLFITTYPFFWEMLRFQVEQSISPIQASSSVGLLQIPELLSLILVTFGLLGASLQKKDIFWWSLLLYGLTIFSLTTIFPSFNLLNNNPTRFLTYLAFPLIVFMSTFLERIFRVMKRRLNLVFISLVIISLLLMVPSTINADKNLFNQEEINELGVISSFEANAIIFAQPINWHEIRFVSGQMVYFGATEDIKQNLANIFGSGNPKTSSQIIRGITKNPAYVVISNQKLESTSQFPGWWNELSYKNSINLRSFEDDHYFKKIFQGNQTVIFKLVSFP